MEDLQTLSIPALDADTELKLRCVEICNSRHIISGIPMPAPPDEFAKACKRLYHLIKEEW